MLADLVPFGPRFSTCRDSVPGQVYHHARTKKAIVDERSAIWTRSGGRILSRLRVVRSEVRGFPLPCLPTAPDAAMRRAVLYGDAWHPIRFRIAWLKDVAYPRLRRIADAALGARAHGRARGRSEAPLIRAVISGCFSTNCMPRSA